MRRRYQRPFSPEQTARFGAVLRGESVTDAERELLYCYAIWKRLLDKEAAHVGSFGHAEGRIYVTVVHSGYMVPTKGEGSDLWATREGEIAQLGPIPWKRIVGFMKINANNKPVSPIFLWQGFLQQEPKACAQIYEIMSSKMSPRSDGQ